MFTVAEIWKQPKCPSTDDWHKRICTHTHTHILVLVFVLSHSVVSNSLWPPWSVAPTRLLCPWGFSILQARILEWLQCCPPGNLPNPGIKPMSPALQVNSLPSGTHTHTHTHVNNRMLLCHKKEWNTVLPFSPIWMDLQNIICSNKYFMMLHICVI